MEARSGAASVDVDLVARARQGSVEAQEELARRHWRSAYRVAYLLVHDMGLAEDLAQEAVVAALGALDRFDERRSFRPWLERIAANRAYDWHRRQARAPEVIDTELVEVVRDEDLEIEIASAYTREALLAALHHLDMRFRVPVVLRYLVEMDLQEIAELTEVPNATVRTRIHRGLGLLRAELSQQEEGIDEQAG